VLDDHARTHLSGGNRHKEKTPCCICVGYAENLGLNHSQNNSCIVGFALPVLPKPLRLDRRVYGVSESTIAQLLL
jgi:hypothetical protein